MQTSSQTAFHPVLAPANQRTRSIQTDDRVYQAVTVIAILMVLGSLWVF